MTGIGAVAVPVKRPAKITRRKVAGNTDGPDCAHLAERPRDRQPIGAQARSQVDMFLLGDYTLPASALCAKAFVAPDEMAVE